MSKKDDYQSHNEIVVPGEKIAIIEEFLPDETCFEEEGEIFSSLLGNIVTDRKKHKISIVPKKRYLQINVGDIGIGRVEFVKKQVASLNLHYVNNINIPLPVNAILHVSEASKHYVRNMYEVARPGDWLAVKIIRTSTPLSVGLVGSGLGVIIAFCNHCGQEIEYKRQNLLECPNCGLIQPRITSRNYGKPIIYKPVSHRDENKRQKNMGKIRR
ncbi:exosome complex RNA-binding protein Csl4 [Candidatus Hodarchaeum mangrovi]